MKDYKQGEHPLADVLHYVETYGLEADMLIRAICLGIGVEQTYEWWGKEIGPDGNGELALQKANARYEEIVDAATRAKAIPAIYPMRNYPKK